MKSFRMHHDSAAHKLISFYSAYLYDAETFVPSSGFSDRETAMLEKGQRDLHSFMKALYADMYENPHAFYIPFDEYDGFLGGRSLESLSKSEKTKAATLKNRFKQAIRVYQQFLFEAGGRGVLSEDKKTLILSMPVFQTVMAETSRYTRTIKTDRIGRLASLQRVGIEIQHTADGLRLSCSGYPYMFAGLFSLCGTPDTDSGFTHFLTCNFHSLDPSYHAGLRDVMNILPPEYVNTVTEIDTWMKGLNGRFELKAMFHQGIVIPWKATYKKHSKALAGFWTDGENLDLYLYFSSYHNLNRTAIFLEEQSKELCDWFGEHIPVRECKCKHNRLVRAGEKRIRTCGLMSRMEVKNPDSRDMGRIKLIVEMFLYI